MREIWGGTVARVPWQRPGWELDRTVAALVRDPGVIGAVLGGLGLTAWGRLPAGRGALHVDHRQGRRVLGEVLPEHVASAVVALTTALPVTTGQLITVDSEVDAACLR